jgi:hypothetical protein
MIWSSMDPFHADFEQCRDLLKFSMFDPPPSSSAMRNLSGSVSQLRADAERRLNDTKSRHMSAMKLIDMTLQAHVLAKEAVQIERERLQQVCEVHQQVIRLQMQKHQRRANRRLRELLFEVIGEYGKTDVRIARRFSYLKYASRVSMVWSLWKLRWERFALRLCVEASTENTLLHRVLLLCPRENLEEIRAVGDALQKALPDSVFKVSAVVRIEDTRDIKVKSSVNSSNVVIANDLEHYEEIVSTLRTWFDRPLARPTQSTEKMQKRRKPPTPSEKKTTNSLSFLRAKPIEWLQPAANFPQFWDLLSGSGSSAATSPLNFLDGQGEGLDEFMARYMLQHTSFVSSDRVYFCIEERQYANQGQAAISKEKSTYTLDLLESIQSIYCPLKDVHGINASLIETRTHTKSPLKITRQLSAHRNQIKREGDLVSAFPNILKAYSYSNQVEYHFCAALNLNLVETSAFSGGAFSSDQIR